MLRGVRLPDRRLALRFMGDGMLKLSRWWRGCGLLMLALVVCGLHVNPAYAQSPEAAEAQAVGCSGSHSRQFANLTLITSGWTGACVEGLPDGPGRYNERREVAGTTTEFIHEVYLVRGRQAGLACQTQVSSGPRARRPTELAALSFCAMNGLDVLIKRDGELWRGVDLDGAFVEPAVTFSSDEVERESNRLIAAARQERVAQANLTATAMVLNDLVGGARIRVNIDSTLRTLQGRRVAIVLSSRAIEELARWRVERERLLTAFRAAPSRDHGRDYEEAIQTFEAQTRPENFVFGVASTVQAAGGSAFAADDLSVLQDGSADYVLAVDWSFTQRVPQSLSAYRSMPSCDRVPGRSCADDAYLSVSFAAYLISPELEAVYVYERSRHAVRDQGERTLSDMILNASFALHEVFSTEDRYYLPRG